MHLLTLVDRPGLRRDDGGSEAALESLPTIVMKAARHKH